MSPRAAWWLVDLGFEQVYDYVSSKIDWFGHGLPREGKSAGVSWAGDLVRSDPPSCSPDDRIGELRERVTASGFDLCVVVNEQRVVLGLLRGDALGKDPTMRAVDAMELGPRTIRPSNPVEKLLESRSSHGVKSWIVTTPRGVLLGTLIREEAERALEESRAKAEA